MFTYDQSDVADPNIVETRDDDEQKWSYQLFQVVKCLYQENIFSFFWWDDKSDLTDFHKRLSACIKKTSFLSFEEMKVVI